MDLVLNKRVTNETQNCCVNFFCLLYRCENTFMHALALCAGENKHSSDSDSIVLFIVFFKSDVNKYTRWLQIRPNQFYCLHTIIIYQKSLE